MSDETILLKDLLESAAKRLSVEFEEIRANNPHHGEAGSEIETVVRRFLKDRLPKRFDAEKGFVVGLDGKISQQMDVIIYDALNCPVYRRGEGTHVIPRDNVAAVLEVKSNLNKKELEDAAKKIASAKKLKHSPISGLDEPTNRQNIATTELLGCVFAFNSTTSLQTLSDNLKELNQKYDSREWIDFVLVLDKGIIGYLFQSMFGSFSGWYGGSFEEHSSPPPAYVQLGFSENKDLALNQFYVRLMSHLSLFRRRTGVPFDAALGQTESLAQIAQGYQFDLSGALKPVSIDHKAGSFKNPKIRFNIYDRNDGKFLGQVCYLPWQDGACITYSGYADPSQIFAIFAKKLKMKINYIVPVATQGQLWVSTVHKIDPEAFTSAAIALHNDLYVVADDDSDSPPPMKIDIPEH